MLKHQKGVELNILYNYNYKVGINMAQRTIYIPNELEKKAIQKFKKKSYKSLSSYIVDLIRKDSDIKGPQEWKAFWETNDYKLSADYPDRIDALMEEKRDFSLFDKKNKK